MYKAIGLFFLLFSQVVLTSDPEILDVKVELTSAQKYNISVTLKHEDTGWEHFANAWRVYSPEGELLGERVLHHPHVKEQPFTRTLRAIGIPSDLAEIKIVANCSETKEAKKSYTVKLR